MPTHYVPLIKSGFGVGVSGQHVYVESGVPVLISGQHLYQESGAYVTTQPSIVISGAVQVISGVMDIHEYGYHILSGEWRPKAVCDSGEIVVCSGLYVVAQVSVVVSGINVTVDISGDPVTISGDHVYVEYYCLDGQGNPVPVERTLTDCSGRAIIIIDSGSVVVDSGLHVIMSGQHFYQESGAFVTTQPSIAVSGTVEIQSGGVIDVREYGWHILSGEWRPKAVCNSGEMVVCSGLYVVADIAESGIGVQVQSGLHVQMSGQHFYQESGAYVVVESGIGVTTVTEISGTPVTISGDHVFIESGAHVIVDSGLGVRANILDTAGRIMEVDPTVPAGVMITTPHHEIHEGNMWHSWCVNSGLADGANLDMLIVTGSGKEVHMAPDGACGGDAWFEIYEGTTTSGNGTLITPNCMHRAVSGTARTLTYCGPTIASTHHPLTKQFMTGGEKKEATGGIIRPNTEWILNGISGSINYLIRLWNVAGGAKNASVAVEFYEEGYSL